MTVGHHVRDVLSEKVGRPSVRGSLGLEREEQLAQLHRLELRLLKLNIKPMRGHGARMRTMKVERRRKRPHRAAGRL